MFKAHWYLPCVMSWLVLNLAMQHLTLNSSSLSVFWREIRKIHILVGQNKWFCNKNIDLKDVDLVPFYQHHRLHLRACRHVLIYPNPDRLHRRHFWRISFSSAWCGNPCQNHLFLKDFILSIMIVWVTTISLLSQHSSRNFHSRERTFKKKFVFLWNWVLFVLKSQGSEAKNLRCVRIFTLTFVTWKHGFKIKL